MDYATPNPGALKEEENETPENNNTSKAAELSKAAAEKARIAAQGVQNKATLLKNAAADKAQQFKGYAGEKAVALKEGASAKAQHVKIAAGEKYEQSKAKAQDLHQSSEEYIRQNPTKCVLGAFWRRAFDRIISSPPLIRFYTSSFQATGSLLISV